MSTWGKSSLSGTDYEDFTDFVLMQGGNFLAESGHKLSRVELYVRGVHSAQVRVAVYRGGDADNNPHNATLVEDLGLTSGSGTDQWVGIDSVSKPSLTASERLWIAVKGNDGGFRLHWDNSGGDDFFSYGYMVLSTFTGTDETVAWAATMLETGGDDIGHHALRLITESGSGGTSTLSFTGSGASLSAASSSGSSSLTLSASGTGVSTAVSETLGNADLHFSTFCFGAASTAVTGGSSGLSFATSGIGDVGGSTGSASLSFATSGASASLAESAGSASLLFSTSGAGTGIVQATCMSVRCEMLRPVSVEQSFSEVLSLDAQVLRSPSLRHEFRDALSLVGQIRRPFSVSHSLERC